MKNIIYLVFSIALVSCSSTNETPSSIFIGETKGMIVTEVNKEFEAFYVGPGEINTRTVVFDINDDGESDFEISCTIDSVFNTKSQKYYTVIAIDNLTEYSFLTNKKAFETITSTTDTVIASVSNLYIHNLQQGYLETSINLIDDYYCISYLEAGFELDIEHNPYGVIESENSNFFHPYAFVYQSNYSELTLSTVDGKYGYDKTFDFSYFNCEINKTFFIAFLKGSQTYQGKLGWIELEILENNTVHVIRTAIQE